MPLRQPGWRDAWSMRCNIALTCVGPSVPSCDHQARAGTFPASIALAKRDTFIAAPTSRALGESLLQHLAHKYSHRIARSCRWVTQIFRGVHAAG